MRRAVAGGLPPGRERRFALGLGVWGIAALAVLGAHVAFAWVAFSWTRIKPATGEPPAALMIDLAPLPASADMAHDRPPLDDRRVPAGDDQAGDAPDVVAVPDPLALLTDAARPPVPALPALPAAVPLPVRPPRPPAARPPKVAAVPRAERKPVPAPAQDMAAAADTAESPAPSATFGSGATASDLPSTWKSRLLAHLNRYKRYPAGARGREGLCLLSFAMDRDGRLLGSFIARSSGDPALDEEALAMIRRADPLPAAPPEIPGSPLQLTVPVRFSIR